MQNDQNVYIVDDDSIVRKSLLALMASHGLTAFEFSSGEEFLEFTNRTHPRGCIVSDVRLGGMSGYQLRKQLIKNGVDTHMILITGFADALPVDDPALTILEKSCGSNVLMERIKEKLAETPIN